MLDKIGVKAEWFFEYEDGSIEGPFFNSFPSEGLAEIAEQIKAISAPYLVVGDDTDEGFAITEVFRKAVSVTTRTLNMIRFRTQLLPSECNGDHQKACIYVRATDTPGTGVMLNMLRRLWSKAAESGTAGTSLTVECKITVQEVV